MKKLGRTVICTVLSCAMLITLPAAAGAEETLGPSPSASPAPSAAPSAEPSSGPAVSATPEASVVPSATPEASVVPSATPTASVAPTATPAVIAFKTAFPDAVFRNFVNEKILGGTMIDTSVMSQEVIEKLGAYSESVDLSFQKISDVTGIEYLTGISVLNVEGNYITKLDVSKLTKLATLNCADNDIKELNLANCPELTSLKCQYNQLSSLDLTKNAKLEELNVYQNALLSLSKTSFVTTNLKNFIYEKMTVSLQAAAIGTQYGVVLPIGATAPITSSLPDNARYLTGSRAVVWSNLTEIPSEFTYEYLAGDNDDIVRVSVYIDKSQIIKNLTVVEKPAAITSASAGYGSVKLTWKKVEGVSGYRIYRSASLNGTYSLVKTISSDSTVTYTNKSLTCGTRYYYKIRAYRTIEGNNYFSDYTSVVNAKPIPAQASVTLKKTASTKVKVSWKKVSGASGYRIYRSTSKNGTYKKVKSITNGSKLTWTNTKLKKKKTYYYKVRAYRKVDSKNIYGAYSAVKYRKL